MNLNSFEAVYAAATELSLQGEPLILKGEGRTLALIAPPASRKREVRVYNVGQGLTCQSAGVLTKESFSASEFDALEVAPQLRHLLTKGEEHGSKFN